MTHPRTIGDVTIDISAWQVWYDDCTVYYDEPPQRRAMSLKLHGDFDIDVIRPLLGVMPSIVMDGCPINGIMIDFVSPDTITGVLTSADTAQVRRHSLSAQKRQRP